MALPLPDDSDAPDDITLMMSVKRGDEEAFQALVERHQYRIVGTVAKMLGRETDAEDIAQQVFVRVWQSASRYEPEAKFTTWLLTITRNLVFNEMRRRRRSKLVEMQTEEDEERFAQHEDSTARSPSSLAQNAELQNAIADAIAALPESQRMAVILRRYEELSYEEIAEVLKTSVPSVKSLLFRARTELKERLKTFLG